MHFQSGTLLFADVFDNFRNMCINIYELDPAKFLSAPGLARQVALKKNQSKINSLTNIDMLMVEKGISGEIYNAVHQYTKAWKYKKDYDKNKGL